MRKIFKVNFFNLDNDAYDKHILWCFFILLTIGLLMVTSSSIYIGHKIAKDPFFL